MPVAEEVLKGVRAALEHEPRINLHQYPVRLSLSDCDLILEAQVPGVRKEDLAVEVTAEGLTLNSEVRAEKEEPEKRYHRQEISYGTFLRTVVFPVVVESDKAVAVLKDGILQVTIPKSTQAKAKPVKVEVA